MIIINKYNLTFLSILFCSLVFYVIFNNYEYYTLIDKSLMIGIFILNLFPFLFFLSNEKEQNFIPLFYLTLVYFFICYSMFYAFDFWSIFYGSVSGEGGKIANYETKDIYVCLKTFFIGILFFNIGYFVFYKFLITSREGFTFLKIKDNKELIIVGLLVYFFIIIAFYLLKMHKIIPGLAQLKYPLNYLSVGLIFLFTLRQKELVLYKKIILYSLILLIFYLEILQGSFAYSFIILIFLYVIYFYYTKKIVILPLIIGCIIFLFFHSFKIEFRNLTWMKMALVDEKMEKRLVDREVELDLKDKNKKFYESMVSFYKKIYLKDLDNKIKTFKNLNVNRIFHSSESLRVVTKLSPEHVPYWEGYSYKILLTKFIPRIFWKDKPSDTLGNQFCHRYKICNPEDYNTSWNMPVLNEFYVNFGIAGVSVGMFLLGLLFRLLTRFFSVNNKNSYEMIIGIITIFPVFFLESHLSLLFGAVLQTFIFLFIFIFIAKNFLRLIYFHND